MENPPHNKSQPHGAGHEHRPNSRTGTSSGTGAGRYAPSPSGDLHFGNLRTAVLAWLFARSTGRQFLMRVEDIDQQRSSMESAQRQLDDLAALGIEWDTKVIYQHDRYGAYEPRWRSYRTMSVIARARISRKQRAHRMPFRGNIRAHVAI